VAASRPLERTVTVSGSFHAREKSTLSVKVAGRLESIAVDIGSVVHKGDKLAQVDLTDYELRVKQAEAVLSQARAAVGLPLEGEDDSLDVEASGAVRQTKALIEEATKNRNRVRQLFLEKLAPQTELDAAEAAYAVAVSRRQEALESVRARQALVLQRRAELNIARKQLSDSTTRAPFDGIVQARLASPGEFVQGGAPLLVIAAVNPLRLRLEVPELESTEIRPGQAIRIRVGRGVKPYQAAISRVSPILTEANRMLMVEADVAMDAALRPGLFAEAEIVVRSDDPGLCVPEAALTSFVGLEKVFLFKEGKAIERGITTGRRTDRWIEVLTGLVAGDRVILNPVKLRSQQLVHEEVNATAR
jgi:RND family efflux transporter MFP subunit